MAKHDITGIVHSKDMNKELALQFIKSADKIDLWVFGEEKLELVTITKKVAKQILLTGTMPTWHLFEDGTQHLFFRVKPM